MQFIFCVNPDSSIHMYMYIMYIINVYINNNITIGSIFFDTVSFKYIYDGKKRKEQKKNTSIDK